MNRRSEQLTRGVDRVVKNVSLRVTTNVVQDTPVDEGRAKSNWIASVGSPRFEDVEPYFPGQAGSTAGENEDAAIANAQAAISSRRPGQPIYVTNTVGSDDDDPYIGKLNRGSSAQAPSRFVQLAAVRAAMSVRNAEVIFAN